MTAPGPTRVYARTGKRAHLLPPLASPNLGYPLSLCSRQPELGDSWRGTGSQLEYEVAAALPLCSRCESLSAESTDVPARFTEGVSARAPRIPGAGHHHPPAPGTVPAVTVTPPLAVTAAKPANPVPPSGEAEGAHNGTPPRGPGALAALPSRPSTEGRAAPGPAGEGRIGGVSPAAEGQTVSVFSSWIPGVPGQCVQDMSDEAALFMLKREILDLPAIARFTIDGEPVSKARARFTGKGYKTQAYTPERTRTAEEVVGWKFRQAAPGHKLDPENSYGVIALFFCGTRQRRDVDNMLKLILDGLNRVAWPDDSQVIEVSAKKALVLPGEARTEVLVYRVGYVQRFTTTCRQCGKDFPIFLNRADESRRKRFCSQECGNTARQTADRTPKPCANCGQEFTPTSHQPKYCSLECGKTWGRAAVTCNRCGTEFTKQKCHVREANYCSTECLQAAARERRQAAAKGTCATCGGPTSKKTYRECNACKLAGKQVTGRPRAAAVTDLGGGAA